MSKEKLIVKALFAHPDQAKQIAGNPRALGGRKVRTFRREVRADKTYTEVWIVTCREAPD